LTTFLLDDQTFEGIISILLFLCGVIAVLWIAEYQALKARIRDLRRDDE
jgi:hypothetical protein